MSEDKNSPTRRSLVSLREITGDTVREICRLAVTEAQNSFVAPNAVSIAQAYFERRAWFRAIYADDAPVGFVMVFEDTETPEYYLWRFMIDARYQGMDFGRRAMEQVISRVRDLPNAVEFITSVVQKEGGPQAFYEKLGFSLTGEHDKGEAIMKMPLKA